MPRSAYARWVNWFSATPLGSRVARKVAAKVDPWIYRLSGGRMTSTGVPTIPQLLLTTVGRKTGKARSVMLGYTPDGDDWLLVASNFGGERHPAWSFNLDDHPDADILWRGQTIPVRAVRLDDDAKRALWPRLVANIPQYGVYVRRTDRKIKVYRLQRRSPASRR